MGQLFRMKLLIVLPLLFSLALVGRGCPPPFPVAQKSYDPALLVDTQRAQNLTVSLMSEPKPGPSGPDQGLTCTEGMYPCNFLRNRVIRKWVNAYLDGHVYWFGKKIDRFPTIPFQDSNYTGPDIDGIYMGYKSGILVTICDFASGMCCAPRGFKHC